MSAGALFASSAQHVTRKLVVLFSLLPIPDRIACLAAEIPPSTPSLSDSFQWLEELRGLLSTEHDANMRSEQEMQST
jgi:hypothetical protein